MRVLLVKLSAIGDVVHTLPAAAYLRKALPNAHLAWVVERRAAALLKDTPIIDELIEIDTRALRKNPFSGNAVREQLRQLRENSPPGSFNIAIDFQGLIKSGMVAKASAAPRRFGFETRELREPLSRVFLTEQVQTASERHVIEKNLALARAVVRSTTSQNSGDLSPINGVAGGQTQEYEFPIAVSVEDETYVEENAIGRFERFAILNPGGGWATKLWGAARYAEVADWLWAEYRLTSLVTFGPGEEALADEVAACSKANTAVPFPSTLKQFVALARRAELFIGGDTGPLHIAAACRTPIVGLYGPTSSERNGPFDSRDITVGRDLWCRDRCHRRQCWHWECMEIPVAAVQRAIAERIERQPDVNKRPETVKGEQQKVNLAV